MSFPHPLRSICPSRANPEKKFLTECAQETSKRLSGGCCHRWLGSRLCSWLLRGWCLVLFDAFYEVVLIVLFTKAITAVCHRRAARFVGASFIASASKFAVAPLPIMNPAVSLCAVFAFAALNLARLSTAAKRFGRWCDRLSFSGSGFGFFHGHSALPRIYSVFLGGFLRTIAIGQVNSTHHTTISQFRHDCRPIYTDGHV